MGISVNDIIVNHYEVVCPHSSKTKKVLSSITTCETTAVFCDACKEQLTEPKTDC